MKKSFCILTGVILLCLVLSACSISSISSITNKEPSKVGEVTKTEASRQNPGTKTTDPDAEVPETKPGKKGETEPQTTAAPVKDVYQVGDIIAVKNLKMIYVSSGVYASDSRYYQPKDGFQFIFLEFYVEYSGSGTAAVSYFDFDGYADGYAVDQKYFDEEALSGSLSAGRWNIGKIYFEVPENAEEIEIEYEYDFWNSKKLVFAYEGEKTSDFEPEAKTEPTEGAFKPGDILDTGRFRITYLSCDYFTSDNMFVQPDEGNVFIYLEFEVENISDSDRTIGDYDFHCYADGRVFPGTSMRDDELFATLSPGRKAKGTVAFQIPENASVVEVEYEADLFSDKLIVFTFEK